MLGSRLSRLAVVVLLSHMLTACQLSLPLIARSETSPEPVSGGLGLARAAWDHQYGPAQNDIGSSAFYSVAQDRSAFVSFTPFRGGLASRVKMIEVHLPFVTLADDDVQILVGSLLPPDATFLDRLNERVRGRTVVTDRYSSQSLSELSTSVCGSKVVGGLRPGDITISQAREGQPARPVLVDFYWHCPDV